MIIVVFIYCRFIIACYICTHFYFMFVADSFRNPSEWCKLAYWELTQRVGPLYPVEDPAVNVFGDAPYCDGVSLETLAQLNSNAPDSVRHARCKIGLGGYII
jgi:hypothetical protein